MSKRSLTDEMPHSSSRSSSRHTHCVVMYFHNSEHTAVDGSSDDEDFSELLPGSIKEFELKGYDRPMPALVLGTGITQSEAINQATGYLRAQMNDDSSQDIQLGVSSQQDASDSDATDFDDSEFKRLKAKSGNQPSESDSDATVSDLEDKEFNLSKMDSEKKLLSLHTTSVNSVPGHTSNQDIVMEYNRYAGVIEERPKSTDMNNCDISDVEVYINGEPASHTLTTQEKWEDVMRLKAS